MMKIETYMPAIPTTGALGRLWGDFRVSYFLENPDEFKKSDLCDIHFAQINGTFESPTIIRASVFDPNYYNNGFGLIWFTMGSPDAGNSRCISVNGHEQAALRLDQKDGTVELSSGSEFNFYKIRWDSVDSAPEITLGRYYYDEDSEKYNRQYLESGFNKYGDGKPQKGQTYVSDIINKYCPDIPATAQITFLGKLKNPSKPRERAVKKIIYPAGQIKSKIIDEVCTHYANPIKSFLKSAIKKVIDKNFIIRKGRLGIEK